MNIYNHISFNVLNQSEFPRCTIMIITDFSIRINQSIHYQRVHKMKRVIIYEKYIEAMDEKLQGIPAVLIGQWLL